MVLNHLRCLEQELASLNRYLVAAMNPYAWAWRLLQTIPGIDQISAAMILIEISDDLRRFGSASRLASWAALCPGNNESAGKRKTGKVRHSNPIVRYLLCEAANAARKAKNLIPRQIRKPGHPPRLQSPQTHPHYLHRPRPP
jgi:transposase